MAEKAKKADATVGNRNPKQLANLRPPFEPGNKASPGRPKGSRNKLGEEFLQALQADFSAHGIAAITTVRTERPHEYLKVIAGILPKELNVNTRVVEELSDDDIIGAITALRSISAAKDVGSGTEEKTRH